MKIMLSLGSLSTSVFFQLFDAQIKPMLLYASEIWGMSKSSSIESAHLFACKRLLSVSNRTPNHMVYGETGRYPLYIDSTLSSLRYWLKVSKMPDTRFPKQALIMLKNMIETNVENNVKNWLYDVKLCLETYGYQSAWKNGSVEHEAAFLSSLRQKMISRFREEWIRKMSTSERFTTYSIFKSVHQAEKYLNDITIKKFRDSLIRFRIGINELGVNIRYQSEAHTNRNCPFCPNCIEDERHFVFGCPKYQHIRDKYLTRYIEENGQPTLNIFLVDPTIELSRKFAMYIFYALKQREDLLE